MVKPDPAKRTEQRVTKATARRAAAKTDPAAGQKRRDALKPEADRRQRGR